MKRIWRTLRYLRRPIDRMVLLITPSCEQIVREATGRLDGVALSRYQRFYIQIHMMCCQVCDSYVRNVRTLGLALRRLAGHIDPDRKSSADPARVGAGLTDSARDRMIEHLKKHRRS